MKDLNGLVEYENIENVARTNFSGRELPTKDYKETANKIKEFSKEQIDTIIEKNYNWLYENRNIENNIYELENSKAEKETNLVKRNNLITLLFEEIGNMQRKYNKDVKEAWDIKESTEEFYINREKWWDQSQLEKKDKEIENLKNNIKNLEQEKQNKSGSFFAKLKNMTKNKGL